MKLKGKDAIPDLSYHPDHIRALDQNGGRIIDFVTFPMSDEDLQKWAAWFKAKHHPCFACWAARRKGQWVQLWVEERGLEGEV